MVQLACWSRRGIRIAGLQILWVTRGWAVLHAIYEEVLTVGPSLPASGARCPWAQHHHGRRIRREHLLQSRVVAGVLGRHINEALAQLTVGRSGGSFDGVN